MTKRGTVFIFSAPSGAGKTTIASRVAREFPDIHVGISNTTRKPRGKERNGEEYFFVSEGEFAKMEGEDKFLETANVHGNLYGTSRDEVIPYIKSGTDVVLDIDVQGAVKIKEKIETVSIFILPPSVDELVRRLVKRETDSDENIKRRIANSKEEVKKAYEFDYLVVNNDLERAVHDVFEIIHSERKRIERNSDLLDTFLDGYDKR
ncbi:MAG: guanylate kinase [Deltaproteobacteria bacterium]|uniref:Guanylate kinase n=1 Tax=Candidatus Zymogenus saltonus TaxID=2844893 RepID=A0A9D8KDT6_9DELT|nr:guanylate kinase [Candidatus Zymogenus saltonus]